MRNLKKFLALVLAMVMAFSLMLTASAANPVKTFGDAGSINETFIEAADVLTGMKVFQGDEGGFRPGDNINRAEVAALIYRLATGDTGTDKMDLYTTTHPFTDVPADAWFAGYVGYCWNAGYIKGTTATTFNPYDSVTGYETLAMVLRAMGYDANDEFTGNNWIVNVSATATQRGLLVDVNKTHYANTLYQASAREVVASILFQAAQKARVKYTPAFGYQTGDHTTTPTAGSGGDLYDDYSSLGWLNFGLTYDDAGVIVGNQQTGEKNTRMGYRIWSNRTMTSTNRYALDKNGNPLQVTSAGKVVGVGDAGYQNPITTNSYIVIGTTTNAVPNSSSLIRNSEYNYDVNSDIFNVETGINLFGHRVKIWYDGRGSSFDSVKGHPTYAYFDKAKTDVVKADNTDLTDTDTANKTTLAEAIGGTALKVPSYKKAVFSNSFGKFGTLVTTPIGTDTTDNDEAKLSSGDSAEFDGCHSNAYDEAFLSPVGLYKIICNGDDDVVDAVIALNIESSQITESNAVNRVPTIGLPVYNWAANPEVPVTGSNFIEGVKATASASDKDDNLKAVPITASKDGVITGVLAKDALKGNSASNLGDYEMGIHITGTNRRNISDNEAVAINGGAKDNLESSYFLLNKVTATVEGRVVAYNRAAGTVTLEDGTVLNRSKFYNTVVVKNPKDGTAAPKVSATQAPISAIPQGWVYDAGATMNAALDQWVEGYSNEVYKFYTDYEGKYLGAERSYGANFLYGTYLDYDQKVSTSTFNYYLTGVNMNGEIETVQVSKYWQPTLNTSIPSSGVAPTALNSVNIIGTDNLGIPFRDTIGGGSTAMNGLGQGLYTGMTVNNGTADYTIVDTNINRNEHLVNMARLGIKYAAYGTDGTTANAAFDIREIDIDNTAVTLGARETINGADVATAGTLTSQTNTSKKYFTEATKFILVSGFGTDSVKADVYNGISELKGSAAHVFIKMNGAVDALGNATTIRLNSGWNAYAANKMTYYTESPYTYAQSGDTAMKIDTIILPKAAVTWSGGSGLYYVGNPNYSMINSWGTDAWKYDLYEDGELHQIWLTNDPNQALPNRTDSRLTKDTFLNLRQTNFTANDGEPIYTAGNYSTTGVWTAGAYVAANNNPRSVGTANQFTMSIQNAVQGVRYSAVTRDAQTATFVQYIDGTGDTANTDQLYRVADAKVVNLNAGAKANAGAVIGDALKNKSGEIWPGITDLATLNEAGSISPVTGRILKVAAVVDPDNPLVVTTIYVCWDQANS